jgi:hypothetical protein
MKTSPERQSLSGGRHGRTRNPVPHIEFGVLLLILGDRHDVGSRATVLWIVDFAVDEKVPGVGSRQQLTHSSFESR